VLLSIFAFGVGCLVGRLLGGRWQGITSTTLHATGALIAGITTTLVLTLIDPAFAIGWLLIGYACYFVFGLKNLHVTGMIVLLVGLLMNIAPALANGAVPVSELALVSVGDVQESGAPIIEGARESTDTATSLSSLGDVVPVPLFNAAISLGDLVMLVALADIAANLMLRGRTRELDDAGISYATEPAASPASHRIAVLSPLSQAFTNRPAHAAHRRPRLRSASQSPHEPAHAVPSSAEPVIVLDGAHAYLEQPPAPVPPPTPLLDTEATNGIDLTKSGDQRPIIDLTISPTDQQLCEFLRRRSAADEHFNQLAPPSPGHRRNRGRLRRQRNELAESSG
jgi:hypothetical protein